MRAISDDSDKREPYIVTTFKKNIDRRLYLEAFPHDHIVCARPGHGVCRIHDLRTHVPHQVRPYKRYRSITARCYITLMSLPASIVVIPSMAKTRNHISHYDKK